jgi:hypothetical protein
LPERGTARKDVSKCAQMSLPPQYRAAVWQRVPKLYFPVTSTLDGPGPNHPLLTGDALFEFDEERVRYLVAKRAIVQRSGREPLRETPGSDAIEQAEGFVRAQLCRADPARFDRARLATRDLDALLLELQEDLVVMRKPPGFAAERARAHYLNVCFPSNWSPARLLGKSFLSLHARVPNETGFERGERAQHAAALFAQPAVRFVWSLTPDDLLDHHPETARPVDWTTTQQAFLRVERQVIVPLPAAANRTKVTLFFIRTYVYPRARLHDAQCAVLSSAVAHMSDAMRRYKGMLGHEDRIGELLRAGRVHEPRAKTDARAEAAEKA